MEVDCSTLCAGALNFRDVMLAYGKLSKQQMAHESGGDNIGFEFSGTIVSFHFRPLQLMMSYSHRSQYHHTSVHMAHHCSHEQNAVFT